MSEETFNPLLAQVMDIIKISTLILSVLDLKK